MNYHNILHDDMRNGEGLRVVLFVSGCNHYCKECQNPQTWDSQSGIEFDLSAREELFEQLNKDYISGITFSGGDPLNDHNMYEVRELIHEIKTKFPTKDIWLYTGYTWEEIINAHELKKSILEVDILVDGIFNQDLADVSYHWAGSTNQRVINVQDTLASGEIVLWK